MAQRVFRWPWNRGGASMHNKNWWKCGIKPDHRFVVTMIDYELYLSNQAVHEILVHDLSPAIDCWLLNALHDNLLCRIAVSVEKNSTKKANCVTLAPYSFYFLLCNYLLLQNIQHRIRYFESIWKIRYIVSDYLNTLTVEKFQHCFKWLLNCEALKRSIIFY